MIDDPHATATRAPIDPPAFIVEYGNLLSRYGPDSIPAEQYLTAHRDRPGFSELAQTAARMKESAKRLKAAVEHQDQVVRDRFTQWDTLEQQITQFERERRIAQLEEEQRAQRQRNLAIVSVLTVAFVFTIIAAGMHAENQTRKNKELLDLLNNSIAPFAYYQIPEIEKDNQTSLSTYAAVEKLAKLRKPADYPREWKQPLLYVWARSALVDWQGSHYADDALLREVERRIDYIRGLYPQFGRVDGLQAQVEVGKASHAQKTHDPAAVRAAYEAAVRFNEAALQKEPDLLPARNNLADALLRLGQAAPQPEKLGYFERARAAAEQTVALAKPHFLRGQEVSFVTYLDTLGEIYQHLFEQYAALPTPSEREENQKRRLCDARAVYQAIAWNYEGVSFENWNATSDVESYRKTKVNNLARLRDIEDLARRLGVTCAPEAPITRASGAK